MPRTFASASPTVLQIIQVAENLASIEGSDSVQVDFEILDEMLHDPDDLVVSLEKVCLVFLVGRVHHELVKGIP